MASVSAPEDLAAAAAAAARMGPPAKADVTLRLANHNDVPVLASIADAAFRTDSHTQLKAAFHGPDNFADGMQQALEAWVNHPKVDVVVAVNPAGGQLVGWAGWVRRGFAGDTDLPLSGPSEEPTVESRLAGSRTTKTIKDLEDLANASMEYWVARFMPEGSRCRFLCSYVVHPEFQSRGVGSRLMSWGTDRADREPGVFCWVQSSMGGKAAFERLGFREVGKLEAELDDFAEGKMPGEGDEHVTGSKKPWGRYAWFYMRRDARA